MLAFRDVAAAFLLIADGALAACQARRGGERKRVRHPERCEHAGTTEVPIGFTRHALDHRTEQIVARVAVGKAPGGPAHRASERRVELDDMAVGRMARKREQLALQPRAVKVGYP